MYADCRLKAYERYFILYSRGKQLLSSESPNAGGGNIDRTQLAAMSREISPKRHINRVRVCVSSKDLQQLSSVWMH